jgi:hypothetical protein
VSAGTAIPTRIDLAGPVPEAVPVGTAIDLQVKVTCAAGGDLRGGRVDIRSGEAAVATRRLTAWHDGGNETEALAVTAPDRVGTAAWTVRFPAQEIGGVEYGESALTVSVRTQPHRTSLAVWAVPSPVRIAERFTVTVGAKSSGACTLAGASVEICDETGTRLGDGRLGDTPWPGTAALYWTEISLTAPPLDGIAHWNAAFAATTLAMPHLGSSCAFSVVVVKRPQHQLTVKVVETEGAAPIDDVQVAVGPYRAVTDRNGLARFQTPAGRFALAVWKPGFERAPQDIDMAGDLTVRVAMTRLPEEVKAWG